MIDAPRNSGGAWYFFIQDDFDSLRQRMKGLRQIGAKFVRLWFPWSEIEKTEGEFRFAYLEKAITTIVKSGLRLDITLCPLMAPRWFWEQHPDAVMLTEEGTSVFEPLPDKVQSAPISYWHPQLEERYERFIERSFTKCLKKWAPFVHHVRISMGRLNEPTYPDKHHFWCYDDHAVAAFRAAMREKYGQISALNIAWGTNHGGFDAIAVPRPRDFPGMTSDHRRDFILWYRDSKDDFVLWAIDRLKARLERHQRIVLFPAGSGDVDEHIDRFVEDGSFVDAHPHAAKVLRHMERNFWLLELCAADEQLCAQFAGVGLNARQGFAARLMQRYEERGFSFPLYAQIPALKTTDGRPNDPERVGRLAAELGYYGFAWNKDRDLYVTKTEAHERLAQLRKGFRAVEQIHGGDFTNPRISEIAAVPDVTGVQFSWRTDKPCDSTVIYGTQQGFIKRVRGFDPELRTSHEVRLDDDERLESGVRYFYVVAATDGNGNFTCSDELSFEMP